MRRLTLICTTMESQEPPPFALPQPDCVFMIASKCHACALLQKNRVGQNRRYTSYMPLISLPKIPNIHCIYMVLANPMKGVPRLTFILPSHLRLGLSPSPLHATQPVHALSRDSHTHTHKHTYMHTHTHVKAKTALCLQAAHRSSPSSLPSGFRTQQNLGPRRG